METRPGEGVVKEEKFPHSRKPSHRRVCGEFWHLRGKHNWEGKKGKKQTNKQTQNTCLTTTASERVSWCLETSLLWLPPQGGSPSLTLLSLFLSFIFFPTSFRRQWAAFLGAWCLLPAFRSCFVEFTQRSNVLSMNLWGRKWSPCPIPLPSEDHPLNFLKLTALLRYDLHKIKLSHFK